MGVGLQIEQLPLVHIGFIETNEFVSSAANAIVTTYIGPSGKLVVVVIECSSPIRR